MSRYWVRRLDGHLQRAGDLNQAIVATHMGGGDVFVERDGKLVPHGPPEPKAKPKLRTGELHIPDEQPSLDLLDALSVAFATRPPATPAPREAGFDRVAEETDAMIARIERGEPAEEPRAQTLGEMLLELMS
jgi:hypothetical protein